jgi:hypothetical protein
VSRIRSEAEATRDLFYRIAGSQGLDPKRWQKWWRQPSKPLTTIAANRKRRKQQAESRRRNRR